MHKRGKVFAQHAQDSLFRNRTFSRLSPMRNAFIIPVGLFFDCPTFTLSLLSVLSYHERSTF